MITTHLTHTGQSAGTPLCGAPRGSLPENLHAGYAPLHRQEIRESCCRACLATWLVWGYDGEWQDFPATIDEVAKLESEIPPSYASDKEVARFREYLRANTSRP